MLHCLTDQTLLGQRRLAPNLSGYGLCSFVNFAFLSPNEQPHTRRSGGVKHRLRRARCKGILRKETIKRRSFGEQFRPQTSRLEMKYQYRRWAPAKLSALRHRINYEAGPAVSAWPKKALLFLGGLFRLFSCLLGFLRLLLKFEILLTRIAFFA